jgi:hypothetical protein
MHKIKIFLTLLIVHCTLLIGEASAQWWVNGGNLLWPYGDVTIANDLNVEGTIINEGVRPYKVYTALLTTQGIIYPDNPIVTVLENTLSKEINVLWTNTGMYKITFADNSIFDTEKTTCLILNKGYGDNQATTHMSIGLQQTYVGTFPDPPVPQGDWFIELWVQNITPQLSDLGGGEYFLSISYDPTDNELKNTFIEIRVYP